MASSFTGKGNEGWKIADDPTASPRLGMIINPAPFGATTLHLMQCLANLQWRVGASGRCQVKNSTSNSEDKAFISCWNTASLRMSTKQVTVWNLCVCRHFQSLGQQVDAMLDTGTRLQRHRYRSCHTLLDSCFAMELRSNIRGAAALEHPNLCRTGRFAE